MRDSRGLNVPAAARRRTGDDGENSQKASPGRGCARRRRWCASGVMRSALPGERRKHFIACPRAQEWAVLSLAATRERAQPCAVSTGLSLLLNLCSPSMQVIEKFLVFRVLREMRAGERDRGADRERERERGRAIPVPFSYIFSPVASAGFFFLIRFQVQRNHWNDAP